MSERTAAHSIELTGSAAPDWVHLLPMGQFKGRDGRGPYVLRDQAHAQAVIAATSAYQGNADIPVDYDHQIMWTRENGKPAIASGWVKELQTRPDGIWGRVEWTAIAAQHITAKEYRYLSPVFDFAKADGAVLFLRAVGLVNNPNLGLTAIASQQQGEPMEELLNRLRAIFGMAATATEADIAAHCQKFADGGKSLARVLGLPETTDPAQIATAAHAAFGKVAKALKLTEAATVEQIATAAHSVIASATATGTPDPKDWVPMAAFTEVQTQVAAMAKQINADAVETAINAAMAAGKVSPALKTWATDYAAKDMPGFQAWLTVAPVIVTPSTSAHSSATGQPPLADPAKLSAEETAICSAMGVSTEDFLKLRNAGAAQ